MDYTKDKKKAIGAFYTPPVLSNLLARLLLPLCKSFSGSITLLDPATGDSILLQSFIKEASKKDFKLNIIGLDIDSKAIKASKEVLHEYKDYCTFINTDALYPLRCSNPSEGWNNLSKKYFPNGIDIVVSNPPWGVNLAKYTNLSHDFITAVGQFDIYDIFIETILSNLKVDGVYGIIIPDSIYCQEHQRVRETLLTQTAIKGIIRLGEGFFPDVNFAVSIIYGIKKSSTKHYVTCSHLSNSDRKMVIEGARDIYQIVKDRAIKVPVKQMISSDYNFTIDVTQSDTAILQKLKALDTLGAFTTCHRGIELSKKGVVCQCPHCKKWFPLPRKKNAFTLCPHCNSNVSVENMKSECIISNRRISFSSPLLVGEDIGRFNIRKNKYIKKDVNGINYKADTLYEGPKVLVRKTGVGITAGIDYNNCLTNQVVYIIKPKSSINPLITVEVIAAFLCSRVLTYVIIKEKGSIGWTSNPYLSQKDVCSLPLPSFDYNDGRTVDALNRITELVRKYMHTGRDIPTSTDAEIEKNIAYLYHLDKIEYDLIFKTISKVEQMIPFSRLLKIKCEDIFQNGI